MKREFRKEPEKVPAFLNPELLDRIVANTNTRLLARVKENRKGDQDK